MFLSSLTLLALSTLSYYPNTIVSYVEDISSDNYLSIIYENSFSDINGRDLQLQFSFVNDGGTTINGYFGFKIRDIINAQTHHHLYSVSTFYNCAEPINVCYNVEIYDSNWSSFGATPMSYCLYNAYSYDSSYNNFTEIKTDPISYVSFNFYFMDSNIYDMLLGNYNPTSTYSQGYDDGYRDGKAVGGNESYQTGYQEGMADGRSIGYQDGITSADGYQTGYRNGYQNGINQSNRDFGLMNLFTGIADTPILMMRSMFGFEIFGSSVLAVVLSLFTALVVIHLLKRLLK